MKFKILSYVVLLFVWVHSLSIKTHLLYTHQWKCQEIFWVENVFSHVTITSCLPRCIDQLWLHKKSLLLHPKKIFKLNGLVFVRHCCLRKKPSPQLRTSFGDGPWAVIKSSIRVFSTGGRGYLYGPPSRQKQKRTQRDGKS